MGKRGGSSETGERKLVTMLFADLSGFTALAETLDPEDVYAFLRPTMDDLQGIVEAFGGSVPQIQGDGFMAVFGVPRAHEDDAERAVRAALAVRDRIQELNAATDGLRLPEIHAGVNTGEVMVAPSDEAAGFAVVGDTVNTASRVAGLATGGEVLVTETTRRLTEASIRYGPVRRRRAKGKADPLPTFEALGLAPSGALPSRHGFVDREDILGVLGAELELVERTGACRILVVSGEPGIGKSRLALELGHSLGAGRFLVGRCPPFGDRRPLAALAEAVAQALEIVPGAAREEVRAEIDRAAGRIARGARSTALAADLRTLLGVEADGSGRSERDAARAARLVLDDVAGAGVVALVLDDLQWADPSLRSLLEEIARDPWPSPVLILGLSREPLAGLPDAALPALDPDAMRSLAELLLGEPGSAVAVRVPVTRANGNALFLEEMVGMLIEAGAVRHETGGWSLADPGALREVPPTIRLLIAARLDALPPSQKQVLLDASVCGTATWDGLLATMCDVPDLEGDLRALVERDLLRKRPSSTVPGTTEYGWKHALIRDVAYDAMPRAARADRHLDVASWLRSSAARGREPIGAVAFHYERAWELSRRASGSSPTDDVGRTAAEYLTLSGEHMFRHQAREAEPLFRRALEVADATGRASDPTVVVRASLGLAEVLIEMGDHEDANAHASRARRLAERVGDRDLEARALLALGRSASDLGRMRRARTLLEEARHRYEEVGDLRGQGWALHHLSETWGMAGFDRELDDLRAAYEMFSRARDRFGRATVAHDLAYILSVDGGREYHRWYEQARRLSEDDGDLRSRSLLLRTHGHHCYSSGRFGEAAAVMAACRPAAVEAGDRYAQADGLVIGALAGVNVGDPAVVEALAREGIALGRDLGSTRTPALARLALARAAVRQGRIDVSGRALRAARDAVWSRRARVMYADVAEAEAMTALDRGAWGLAIGHAGVLRSALDAVPMRLWEPLPALIEARALLGQGWARDAVGRFDAAIRAARDAGATGSLSLARVSRSQAAALAGLRAGQPALDVDPAEAEVAAVQAETTGVAALLRGDLADAVTALDLAVERWEPMGSTSWLARALALRAEAQRASGDRARAAASMGWSRSVAARIGMPKADRTALEHPLEEPSGSVP